jgi:D-xylose transport system permease protein
VLSGIVNKNLSPTWTAVLAAAVVAVFAALTFGANFLNRRRGLAAEPVQVAALKVLVLTVIAVVLVVVCDKNRATGITLHGMPYIIPLVLALIGIYTFVLGRTRFGRYVYAIGGNAEAARRAGIKVNGVRVACYVLAGFTAALAGVLYDSVNGGASSNFEGGTFVLYAVAVAVIGGTSLFGGRGRMVGALIGGLVIAAVYNGTNLVGYSDATQYIVNAVVLLIAVTIDAVARRGRISR